MSGHLAIPFSGVLSISNLTLHFLSIQTAASHRLDYSAALLVQLKCNSLRMLNLSSTKGANLPFSCFHLIASTMLGRGYLKIPLH